MNIWKKKNFFQDTNHSAERDSPKLNKPKLTSTASLNRNSLDYTKNETRLIKQQMPPYSRNSLK